MSDKADIKSALVKLLGKETDGNSVICKVDSVDVSAKTAYCLPVDETVADIPDARICASDSDNSFLVIPKVDSYVVVTMISESTGYVAMFSEIESIYLNGDTYGGLIKVKDLVTKLNNLENAFNTHVTKYNTHTHSGVQAGAGATTPPIVPETTTLITTTQNELENTTVKHG